MKNEINLICCFLSVFLSVKSSFSVEIPFSMPFDGNATIQIRDEAGGVVANPLAEQFIAKGAAKAVWDLTDIDGAPVLKPGTSR